jgi:Domain of unknown function (DUF4397)
MIPTSTARARRHFLLGCVATGASLAAATSGCGGVTWGGEAKLRAVNATLDLAAVDVQFNDWLFARSLAYGAHVSAYASRGLLSLGAAGRLAVSRAGQSTVLLSTAHTLAEDFATSVVLTGSQSTGLSLLALDEDARHPGGAAPHLRLLHAWPGAGALDVHITSADQVIAGRAPDWMLGRYGELSSFGTPSQATRLRITPRSQPGWVLFDSLVTAFAAGQVLTLIVAPAPGTARVAVAALPQGVPGYVLTNLATA